MNVIGLNCWIIIKITSIFIASIYFIYGISVFLKYPEEYKLIGFLILLSFIFLSINTLRLKIWVFNLNIVLNVLFICFSIFAYFPPFGFDNFQNPAWNYQFYKWILTISPSTLIILVIFGCQKYLKN